MSRRIGIVNNHDMNPNMSEKLCNGYEGDDEVMSMEVDDVGAPGTEQMHDDSEKSLFPLPQTLRIRSLLKSCTIEETVIDT